MVRQYKCETTILFNEQRETRGNLHVVHRVPGTVGTGTNLKVCYGTQNKRHKERQQ